jgi:hypothetical protein
VKKRSVIWKIYAAVCCFVVFCCVSCAFPYEDGNWDKSGGGEEYFSYDQLTKLAFMGGSLIYNPELGAAGQIVKRVKIAIRLSKVEVKDSGEPDELYKETECQFGYITVEDVNSDSIRLSYSEYNSAGNIGVQRPVTIPLGGSGDLNGDGFPDVSWDIPQFKRSGMEEARYLNFIASSEHGNVSMYSVVPAQYARGAYPNGIMGVNPDGRLILTRYQPSGDRAAVRGAEYGDIVVDTRLNNYGYIRDGAKFRIAAVRIGDAGENVSGTVLDPEWTGAPITAPGDDAVDGGDPGYNPIIPSPDNGEDNGVVIGEIDWFTKEQFTVYATVQKLYEALPSAIKSGTPSSEDEYIAALNTIILEPPREVITAVLDAGTNQFTTEFINGAGELTNSTEYPQDSSSISTSDKKAMVAAVNRAFLSKAYPALCPLPTAKTIQEMFPILSVDFSTGDANVLITEQIAELRRIQTEFNAVMAAERQGTSRAAASGYTTYQNRKNQVQKDFESKFTNFGSLTFDKKIKNEIKNVCNDGTISITIGLYGSLKCYWGKIELGVGAALLLNGEIDGPKVSYQRKFALPEWEPKKTIQVGPVLLDVGVSLEAGIKTEANVAWANGFIGFIGLYGGRVWVGADYGVRFKWKVIPVGAYFNTYTSSEKISETVFYGGPKADGNMLAESVNFIVSPYISFGPKLTLWKTIYGKIACGAEMPSTLTLMSRHVDYTADLVFGASASAGIKYDFKIFSYKKEFAQYEIIKKTTFNIAKGRLF